MNLYTLKKGLPVVFDKQGRVEGDLQDKHIGKRYAAGIWCWDCKVPMYSKNEEEIVDDLPIFKRLKKCPKCGKPVIDNKISYNSALRELGMESKKPVKHTGIDGASGFIWCLDNDFGIGSTVNKVRKKLSGMKHIITEYGDLWTIDQFNEMFNEVIEEDYSHGKFF